jgi:AcrR family transcriptional regulator
MARPTSAALKPRKSPRQARSTVTVEAIHTAAIQVLLTDGVGRLTTTRVAERAGVSVGTMYQYYPHKEALMFAIIRAHVGSIIDSMMAAADRLSGQTLARISDGLVAAWLDLKTEDLAGSRATYGLAAEFDISDVTRRESERLARALEDLLRSARDAVPADPQAAAFMLIAVMGGAVRNVLEQGAQAEEIAILRAELPRVCRAYLASGSRAANEPAMLTPA